ncbi:7,8-dihydro-8-oxoguanine triphosphatase [Trichonephila clavata]|uniref:Oxidized purine nucleoside triphosphate hydrolase n=1 Tax=Trichonephila clavata TaxID=2740835 RepID=A0A8X6J201_TRICU|nr:7,8-dihydro-8-oxoguanine triphosphatase [Trichonephila clavata]
MIPTKVSSLVLLRQNGKILLGLKKRGFGIGKWNGFGGKIEKGETILECAKRELLEEAGMVAECLEEVGYLEFEFVEDPLIMKVHVFTSSQFHGDPHESEEMCPQWFPESQIPLDQMWADDRLWFPLLLRGAKFKGSFKFMNLETISWYSLEEVTLL